MCGYTTFRLHIVTGQKNYLAGQFMKEKLMEVFCSFVALYKFHAVIDCI